MSFYLQERVADFGDPRSPVALADAAVALLRSGHGSDDDAKCL